MIDPETIRIVAMLTSAGIFSYCILSGIAKVIKAVTIARKIEQAILNQIEEMVKAKELAKKKSEEKDPEQASMDIEIERQKEASHSETHHGDTERS